MPEREMPHVKIQPPIKPPEFFHTVVDQGGGVEEQLERYFLETMALIHQEYPLVDGYFKRDSKTLAFGSDSNLYPTNDRITYLTAEGQLIAFVLESRTLFNNVDVSMVSILTPRILEILRSHYELSIKDAKV